MRNEHTASARTLRAAVIAAVVIAPAILISVLVARYYVAIPFQDEWELAPLISADSVSIQALFHQHNEHRSFFPKLILTLLGRSTGWSQHYEPTLNVIFALLTVGVLVQLARREKRGGSQAMLVAGFAASVFLFSPAQYDVWLWPWMIVSTLTVLLLCSAALGLASRTPFGFGGAILCCAVAGVSSAQGLFTWIALLPAAVWNASERRVDKGRAVIWTLAGLGSWALYFLDFKTSQTGSIITENLRHPLPFAEFVIGVIGAPWTRSDVLSFPIGLLQLALLLWVGVRVMKRGDASRALSLLGIGAWTLLFAAASAAGRLQYGTETALTSRYLASSAVLPAAFFALVAILLDRQPRGRFAWLGVITLVISATWIASARESLPAWEEISLNRVRGAKCLAMSSQTMIEGNRCLELINPRPAQMIERVDALERAGVRIFRRAEPVPFAIERRWVGRLSRPISGLDYGSAEVSGLVLDPTETPNLGLIFIAYGEDRLWCCGFTEPGLGVAASPATGSRAASRWSARLPIEILDRERLLAFALMPAPDRLSRLDGSVSRDRIESTETVYSASQREVP